MIYTSRLFGLVRIILLPELDGRAACFCHDSEVYLIYYHGLFMLLLVIQTHSCRGFWAVRINVYSPYYGRLQFADLVLLTLNELLRNENNS